MIPLLLSAAAPPVMSGAFAYWLGRSGAPAPSSPVTPPMGSYWHVAYWPDTAIAPKKKRRTR